MKIIKTLYAADKSLFRFFIIPYLIPIVATVFAFLTERFPTDSVARR